MINIKPHHPFAKCTTPNNKKKTTFEPVSSKIIIVILVLCLFAPPTGGLEKTAKARLKENKIRHIKGKYTVKEEVVKRVEHSYPCRLVQTAVKVTFPGMKSEVLVSFLGYKEPNLMHVMRCKGLCSSGALSPVACVPTKRRLKKVEMHLKTQVLGSNAREKFRELVLEEHEECGCQCLTVTPAHCMEPHLFNNETCACTCDTSLYKRDQLQCEAYSDRKWDPVTCSCRKKDEVLMHHQNDARENRDGDQSGVAAHKIGKKRKERKRMGHDIVDAIPGCPDGHCGECTNPNHGGPGHVHHGIAAMPNSTGEYFTDNSWTAIGICFLLVGMLMSTTVYYWRKYRRMAKSMLLTDDVLPDDDDSPAHLSGDELAEGTNLSPVSTPKMIHSNHVGNHTTEIKMVKLDEMIGNKNVANCDKNSSNPQPKFSEANGAAPIIQESKLIDTTVSDTANNIHHQTLIVPDCDQRGFAADLAAQLGMLVRHEQQEKQQKLIQQQQQQREQLQQLQLQQLQQLQEQQQQLEAEILEQAAASIPKAKSSNSYSLSKAVSMSELEANQLDVLNNRNVLHAADLIDGGVTTLPSNVRKKVNNGYSQVVANPRSSGSLIAVATDGRPAQDEGTIVVAAPPPPNPSSHHQQPRCRPVRQSSATLDRRDSSSIALTAICTNCTHPSLIRPSAMEFRSQHHLAMSTDDPIHHHAKAGHSTATTGRRRGPRHHHQRHQSYHHHHRHPFGPQQQHHRSHGQLLIDDADLLHQCLVSLAGEHNVNLLLKRFQQRALEAQPPSPETTNDARSPCWVVLSRTLHDTNIYTKLSQHASP